MPRNSQDNSLASYNEAKNLFNDYLEAKRIIRTRSSFIRGEENQIVKKTDRILSRLRDQHKFVLINTFINDNPLYWWTCYYSQTKFYRIRNQAIAAFLLAYRSIL